MAHSSTEGQRIGLALSGGGARGFGHIPVLEGFDRVGIRPARIAGTSMGALVAALYASGMNGEALREYALNPPALLVRPDVSAFSPMDFLKPDGLLAAGEPAGVEVECWLRKQAGRTERAASQRLRPNRHAFRQRKS